MQNLRGSPGIVVYLFYFLCLWTCTNGVCPEKCICSDETLQVFCNSTKLDLVPIFLNPGLRYLNLNNNRINTITASLNLYHNLEYLDISHNDLTTLGTNNFNHQFLKELHINHNNISQLQQDVFRGLNSLQILSLSGNLLESISAKTFMHLQSLIFIDLSENIIANINETSFFGLEKLKTLILRGNKLTNIPSASFQHIPQLSKLDLSFNYFKNIPEKSFALLTNLNELALSGCGIEVIIYGAFKWLTSLLVLFIDDNKLPEIPTKALFDIMQLKEIYIGKNKFLEIKTKSFQRLKDIQTVDISDCPELKSIERNAFVDNVNLKTININKNKALKYIEDGVFNDLPNLKMLSLKDNGFETFQASLFPLNTLQSLDVSGNPLVCNCSLLWLWKLLLTKNSSVDYSSDSSTVVCQSPSNLRGKNFHSLTEEDLECYSVDSKRQIIIGIVLGAAVAFGVILMLGFKYRDKVAGLLKNKWGNGRKEPHYQKTSAEEESTIFQAAHQSLKMTPVTEL